MKYNPKENPLKIQDIILKNGEKVSVSWKRKGICKKCKEEVWEAVKGKKIILIELTSLAEWDIHKCKT